MNWNNLLNSERIRSSNREKDLRNEFESDYGRIIFSPAIRRMHDKTQVFPLTTDDNIHSRLTHSMEVMSVGYTLGVKLCKKDFIQNSTKKSDFELYREIPLIIQNCCLVHDIGNPPFGHFGEEVIQQYFKEFFENNSVIELDISENQKLDFLDFDGNAQGLRVLTKLQYLNDSFGLNLTYATLGSYIKYPNYGQRDKSNLETKKHGVFYSEKDYFEKIVYNCALKLEDRIVRHPLCYLMEAADSICYLVMDIEDGINKNFFGLEDVYEKLKDIPGISERVKYIFNDPDKCYRNQTTQLVNLRIFIIQYLVDLASSNFEEHLHEIELGIYNKELIEDDKNGVANALKDLTINKIFKNREIVSLEVTGHSTITGLLDYYIKFVFHKNPKYREKAECLISKSIIKAALDENFIAICEKRIIDLEEKIANTQIPQKEDIEKAKKAIKRCLKKYNKTANELGKNADSEVSKKLKIKLDKLTVELEELVRPELDDLCDYYKLRVIVDFITGMTDLYALNHYKKICGQKII